MLDNCLYNAKIFNIFYSNTGAIPILLHDHFKIFLANWGFSSQKWRKTNHNKMLFIWDKTISHTRLPVLFVIYKGEPELLCI